MQKMKIMRTILMAILMQIPALSAKENNLVRIILTGEVVEPKRIEASPDLSLIEVLGKDGGATKWANPRRFLLIRIKDSIGDGSKEFSRTTHEVREITVESGKNPSIKELGLLDGDIIFICKKRPMN